MRRRSAVPAGLALCALASPVAAEPRVRIAPPDGTVFAVHQSFDLRVEATTSTGLRVLLDAKDLNGETSGDGSTTRSLVRRRLAFDAPGEHVILAQTPDGARAEARFK